MDELAIEKALIEATKEVMRFFSTDGVEEDFDKRFNAFIDLFKKLGVIFAKKKPFIIISENEKGNSYFESRGFSIAGSCAELDKAKFNLMFDAKMHGVIEEFISSGMSHTFFSVEKKDDEKEH